MKQEIIRLDLGAVNCYLGKTENGFFLFDTGGHIVMDKEFSNRQEALQRELTKAGCNPGNLYLAILTHGDNDHVCNAIFVRDHYRAKIAIHADDLNLVENPGIEDLLSSFRYKSLIYKAIFKMMHKTIFRVSKKVLDVFERFTPDILIDENFRLSDYGFEGQVLHLPGHTPGSIAILTASGDLIAGDIFANMGKPGVALNAMDHKRMAESIKMLKPFRIHTVYPGHGKPFPFTELKI
jgi:glyoxylase-like metal-dependent hydrolase (beta-lactamase superfamily II)